MFVKLTIPQTKIQILTPAENIEAVVGHCTFDTSKVILKEAVEDYSPLRVLEVDETVEKLQQQLMFIKLTDVDTGYYILTPAENIISVVGRYGFDTANVTLKKAIEDCSMKRTLEVRESVDVIQKQMILVCGRNL